MCTVGVVQQHMGALSVEKATSDPAGAMEAMEALTQQKISIQLMRDTGVGKVVAKLKSRANGIAARAKLLKQKLQRVLLLSLKSKRLRQVTKMGNITKRGWDMTMRLTRKVPRSRRPMTHQSKGKSVYTLLMLQGELWVCVHGVQGNAALWRLYAVGRTVWYAYRPVLESLYAFKLRQSH